MEIQGIRDTLVNLPSGIFSLFLNNRLGQNVYIIYKIIEHQDFNDIENEVNDTLVMEVHPWPDMTFTAEYDSPCSPLDVIFRATENYPSYTWDFGDGTGASTSTNWVSHNYSSQEDVPEINLQTKLIIETVHGCVDSANSPFTYYPTPNADFQVSPELLHYPNATVTLTNTTTPGSWDFRWDFGDGSTSVEESPEHIYQNTGSYTVTLYAWSTEDCTDTLIREDLISVHGGEGSTSFPTAFRWNESGPTGGAWTPGSQDNTVFHPDLENVAELRLVIFTRLGHRVFESSEVYVGWDGYINSGHLAAQGVYIYKAWITYSDGKEEVITGDVTFLH